MPPWRSRTSAISAGLLAGAVCCSGTSGAAAAKIATEDITIAAGDPGIELYIRNKHPEGVAAFTAARTLLFVHGASQPAEATFDLSLDGFSWMDYIAGRGWDVYMLDIRGYGRSSRPPEMSEPPAGHPPLVRTETALRDIESAVGHILRRRSIPRLSLMGWSWGTTLMGGYAARHPEKVQSLVLYGALWLREPAPSDARPLGAYVARSMSAARARLQAGTPAGRREEIMPADWFAAWSAAALASDPVGASLDPPVLRSPAGVIQDIREFWEAGHPTYDPGLITAPVLLVTGEWDTVTPPDEARAVFERLAASPFKRFVEIEYGSHLMMIEKSRYQLFRQVQQFLDSSD